MAIFPIAKRNEVSPAAGQTSRHSTSVSGTNLKISANKKETRRKEITKFTDSNPRIEAGSAQRRKLSAMDKLALIIKIISSNNPVATTKINDESLCRKVNLQKPISAVSTFQIIFNAS